MTIARGQRGVGSEAMRAAASMSLFPIARTVGGLTAAIPCCWKLGFLIMAAMFDSS
jgi:hypothetical protein